MRLAYFVSSHGFGHAARACAVIEACRSRRPELEFDVFSGVPAWFFEESLSRPIHHHPITVDFGLVQSNALEEDLPATLEQLEEWIPFRRTQLDPLVAHIQNHHCQQVLCDIAPLGLEVARLSDRPSVLIENFTWDWIYRGYAEFLPPLGEVSEYLAGVFSSAQHHIQTEPFCARNAKSLVVPPVSRLPRDGRQKTRQRLDIGPDEALLLVTMGGIEWDFSRLNAQSLTHQGRKVWLVVPGGSSRQQTDGRLIRLPHRSSFYHPDLIAAADGVVGKLGYSTLAEAHAQGVPYGYVPRDRFPESPPLEAWLQRELPCQRISQAAFMDDRWMEQALRLLDMERKPPTSKNGTSKNGSEEISRRILED